MSQLARDVSEDTYQTIYLRDYRSPKFLIKETRLHFLLDDECTLVKSKLQMERSKESDDSSSSLYLHGEGLELVSIKIDGALLSTGQYQLEKGGLQINTVPDNFVLEIENQINPSANKALNGLYKSEGKFCTQCEPHGFRNITYYLDQPDVMSVFTTEIIADKAAYPQLLANGNLIESEDLKNGFHRALWEDPFPKPSYLFALVAGSLACVEDEYETASGELVKLQLYTERGQEDKASHALVALKKSMRWDEEAFGREYDLGQYMIVAVDDFNMGAMENKGLNIFNTICVYFSPNTSTDYDYKRVEQVIGHEYFHNWTGNRVTCQNWFQLSLKEGLTVFREQQFMRSLYDKDWCRIEEVKGLRDRQFTEDAGPLAHPVQPNKYVEVNNFYTATVYQKGAELIRMMYQILGEESFRLAMDEYFKRHDGQAVRIEDFIDCMQQEKKEELSKFIQWYQHPGTPKAQVETQYQASQSTFEITVSQQTADRNLDKETVLTMPFKVALIGADGTMLESTYNGETATEHLLLLTSQTQTFALTDVSEAPTLSFNREFTSPVLVSNNESPESLHHLALYDSDGYTRWEASQRLLNHALVENHRGAGEVAKALVTNLFRDLMSNGEDSPVLQKYICEFPGTYALLENHLPQEDIFSIYQNRKALITSVVNELGELLVRQYDALKLDGASFEPHAIEMRTYAHYLLKLLSIGGNPGATERAIALYETENVSNRLAALECMDFLSAPESEDYFGRFFNDYHKELTILKWYALVARRQSKDALKDIQQLMSSEAFDRTNPNQVRFLLGSYANDNIVSFHDVSGEGYAFFGQQLIEIDGYNPQLAARLSAPLALWKWYDEARQQKIRSNIDQVLAKDGLSKDLYEILVKAQEG